MIFACRLIGMLMMALAVSSARSEAATVSIIEDDIFNCRISLDGQIEKGDAARIARALEDPRTKPSATGDWINYRLCLNSKGGSFVEALEIARIIYSRFGTAVPRGSICESACSIVFMAGSASPEDDRGVIADRYLHPLGRLGFHAPNLVVPEGQYREVAVNKSYKIAIGGVGRLLDIAGYIKMPPSLIAAMLETPPDSMMYVETVGQAVRWMISVAPTKRFEKLTPAGVINVCSNWYQMHTDIISPNGFFDAEKKLYAGFAIPQIKRDGNEYSSRHEGFGQEAASACNVTYKMNDPKPGKADISSGGWVRIGDEVGVEVTAAAYMARDTKIDTLVLENDRVPQTVPHDSLDGTFDKKLRGQCFVFRDRELRDHKTCAGLSRIRVSSGPKVETEIFVWPSGAKTVVRTVGEKTAQSSTEINGAPTEIEYTTKLVEGSLCKLAIIPKNRRCDFNCWLNSKSGNRFCFLNHAAYDTDVTRWKPQSAD